MNSLGNPQLSLSSHILSLYTSYRNIRLYRPHSVASTVPVLYHNKKKPVGSIHLSVYLSICPWRILPFGSCVIRNKHLTRRRDGWIGDGFRFGGIGEGGVEWIIICFVIRYTVLYLDFTEPPAVTLLNYEIFADFLYTVHLHH